jgi:transcription elongation factor GreA
VKGTTTLEAKATAPGTGGADEIVLTPEGYARLVEEYRRLTTVKRPELAARLSQALQVAGDRGDDPESRDARAELDLVEERIVLLERRLRVARVLRPDEPSGLIVSLGSYVVLDDLDEHSREEYVLVSSAESDPAAGRLSNESPVGRAIAGHHPGDLVDVHAPHRVRHLQIADVRVERPGA